MAAILIILGLIVLIGLALGFVIKWLFILALIAALIWLVAFFTGRRRTAA